MVFRYNKSVGHHSDESVGLFRHDKSVGQSQRGSQTGHPINLSIRLKTIQYVKTECKLNQFNMLYHVIHRIISSSLTTSITAMFTLKLLNLLNSYLSAQIYLNRFLQRHGSSSNVDVDFSRWCIARDQQLPEISCWHFSCDDQQRALRDSEATKFCEQEPDVGFVSVFLSGY
ncbi:cyclic nucleotide-gated ion channel 1-like [Dorcoceras hygrometricum]|uniref:Cyclic nucleotide-gated ion channel 1-like n=1 Tax=Dorcoceras hygrometricum TaxID=472368 RepID=A0A2Z7BMA1_9LAMI|nr:cyclic nucleotide-gated ion channel 1-like [Dorcoceras hygrometricum]